MQSVPTTQPAPIVVAGREFAFGARSYILGILNVTPDSFSDGGRFVDAEAAVQAGCELVEQGADLVDVGGESTRPGARAVTVEEELDRVLPVIQGLVARGVQTISIDTRKARVAQAALQAGAGLVNDVSGGRFDPELLDVVAAAQVPCVLMHTRDLPERMQQGEIHYEDVVRDVGRWLSLGVDAAVRRGVDSTRIVLDPGIGFGKTVEHNLALTRGLGALRALGHAVLYGSSRKSFLGVLLGGAATVDRLEGTLASVAIAVQHGADILRVHDVASVRRLLAVVDPLVRGLTATAIPANRA
ncbi:MAG: dihydropteroate synthase [Pseudomonadota bacterium]